MSGDGTVKREPDDRGQFPNWLTASPVPPLSATVGVTFGAYSARAASHAVNEDHYLILELGRHQTTLRTSLPAGIMAPRFDESGYAMVVADGMGDTGAGEGASRLAVVTLVYLVRQFGKWNLRVDDRIAQDIMHRAEMFYRQVDGTVAHHRRENPKAMAQTTLTATFGAGRDLFFAHVGHSRAYLWRRGRLVRLTRDQTTRARATRRTGSLLVDVSTAARDLQHILTDAVGMLGATPTIDLERLQIDVDDRVLVCTNGVTDSLDDSDIGAILASAATPDEQCRALVDQSIGAGGRDDATALVAHYHLKS